MSAKQKIVHGRGLMFAELPNHSPLLTISVKAFSQIKLFLDELLNKIWLARMTILNPVGSNFPCKTCDQLGRSGFAGKSI